MAVTHFVCLYRSCLDSAHVITWNGNDAHCVYKGITYTPPPYSLSPFTWEAERGGEGKEKWKKRRRMARRAEQTQYQETNKKQVVSFQ